MAALHDVWLVFSSLLVPLLLVLCVGVLLACVLRGAVKSLLLQHEHKVHTISTTLNDESDEAGSQDHRSLNASSGHRSARSGNTRTMLSIISTPGTVTADDDVVVDNDLNGDELERSYGPVIEVHRGLRSVMQRGTESNVEPVYYPQHNCSESRPPHMSPMAPLQPPWPHLPPLGGANRDKSGGDEVRRQRRMPSPLRNFFIDSNSNV